MIPWTVAHQASLSMGFPKQEYWSKLSFPPLGDLSNPGIEPGSPTLQVDYLLSEPPNIINMSVPIGGLKSRALPLETLMCLSQIAYLWTITTLRNFVCLIPLPSCMVSFYPCISLAMCYIILVLWAFTSTVTYCTCLCNLFFFSSPRYFYEFYSWCCL